MKRQFETKSGKWEYYPSTRATSGKSRTHHVSVNVSKIRQPDVYINTKLVHLSSSVQIARDLIAEGRAALTEILAEDVVK